MTESQSPAQAPPPPQPQPLHEQCQEPPSPYPYSSDTTTATARPASPFFRHRPLGRAPSPPTWACYEQIPARSELLGSSDDSDSESGDDGADEDSLSDADADADPDDPDDADADDNNSSLSDDAEAAGLMDVEDDEQDGRDPEKRDKGKQRAEAPQNGTDIAAAAATTNENADGKSSPVIPHPPPAARHRRPRHRRPPMSALRPILTIQRSQGFVWNQDLFVPPYIKDRYVASTSPPSSMGVFSPCGSTSTSLSAQDYEIEVVEIRVRDGELDDIIP